MSVSYIDQDNVQKGNAYGAPTTSGTPLDQVFNNSGWSVDFGPGDANATAENQQATGLNLPPWLLAVVAVMLVVGWVRTSK